MIRRKGGKGEDPQLGCLLPRLEWPAGFPVKLAGVGGWGKSMSRRKEVEREALCDLLEMRTDF